MRYEKVDMFVLKLFEYLELSLFYKKVKKNRSLFSLRSYLRLLLSVVFLFFPPQENTSTQSRVFSAPSQFIHLLQMTRYRNHLLRNTRLTSIHEVRI